MDKKTIPVGFHSDMPDQLVIDLMSLAPGINIIMTKSDGTQETLTMEDLNTGYLDNPLTGNIELTLRLTLKKPIDEEPET